MRRIKTSLAWLLPLVFAVCSSAAFGQNDRAEAVRRVDAGRKLLSQGLSAKDGSRPILDNALVEFTAAIKADPTFEQAYANRGVTYTLIPATMAEEPGFREKALADFDKAIVLNPNYGGAYNERGKVRLKKAEAGETMGAAMAGFMAGLGVKDEKGALGSLSAESLKNVELAIADFTKALSLNKDLVEALVSRGKAYRMKKAFDLARADLNRALELAPNSMAAKRELAELPAAVPAARDAMIGDWSAIAETMGQKIAFNVRFIKRGDAIVGQIVNDAVGQPLDFREFVINADRSFSFHVVPPTGVNMSCKGKFGEDFKTMTGTTSIMFNGTPLAGVWNAQKR